MVYKRVFVQCFFCCRVVWKNPVRIRHISLEKKSITYRFFPRDQLFCLAPASMQTVSNHPSDNDRDRVRAPPPPSSRQHVRVLRGGGLWGGSSDSSCVVDESELGMVAEWQESCTETFALRHRNLVATPRDGTRPLHVLGPGEHPRWTAIMITDAGYTTLRRTSGISQNVQDVPSSRVALWMIGRDTHGRSVSVWIHHLVPYFYVGISHPDPAWAKSHAPAYAQQLKGFLDYRAGQEKNWRNRPQVLDVRPVRRRWFYGYRFDPKHDQREPRWDPREGGAPNQWDGSTTQASDWYLKVSAGAPYHVNQLRKWAAEWAQSMGKLPATRATDRWKIPQVRTTSTVMAPVELTVFEANVEFSLRSMIDRGLVGCGWCVLDLEAVDRPGTGITSDPQNRSRCDQSFVIDGRAFERAERARDQALIDEQDPWDAIRTSLAEPETGQQHFRFVAREASLQRFVDGVGEGTAHPDPHAEWFEELRQARAPLTVMSFDIECCNPQGSFPEPDQMQSQVINLAMRVYRLDRVEAYEAARTSDSTPDPSWAKAGIDVRRTKWPPPFDAVVMGLKPREAMVNGGMDGYRVDTFSFENEAKMLIAFACLLRQWDPDVIEGYNSVAFDMAFLLRRAETLGIEKYFWDLGRLRGFPCKPKSQEFGNKAKGKRKEYRAHLHGRIQFDLYRVCTDDIALKLRDYHLGKVAYALFREGKKDMKYEHIPYYHRTSDRTRRILDEYCDSDAVLPFKIERHQSYLMRYIELARVTGVPMRFLLTKGQQVLVYAQIVRKARQEGFAVPWLPVVEPEQTLTEARKNKAYQGAVVIDPKVGFYTLHQTGPVVVNDYNSLYPSSMISQNLGYTTHVTDPAAQQQCLAVHAATKPLHDQSQLQLDPWYDGELKLRSYEDEGGWKVAPVESDKRLDPVFVRPEVRKSLVAQILEALLAARAVAKKRMKQFPKGSAGYKVQDARQMALKVCANSVYGFTGAPVGRQPNLDVSGATTGYGRKALYFAKRLAEEFLPGDNEVVYGDTDSVMIQVKDAATKETPVPGQPLSERAKQAVQQAFNRGKLLDDAINCRVLAPMRIETEKVYAPFLLLGRKKYLTLMWMCALAAFGIDAKGIEMVRRDNPHIVGLACEAFASLLMGKGDSIEGRSDQVQALWPDLETAQEFLRIVHQQLLDDQLPFEAYVISAKYTKPAGEYDTIPPHVALQMRMEKRDPGSAPQLGERVPYVLVRPQYSEAVQKHEKSVLYKDKRGVKVRDCSENPDYAKAHQMRPDNLLYAQQKFEPPFLRMLAPVLAKDELQDGHPKDPRMWKRQRERYRDQPEKLQSWIQDKRQDNAEAIVHQDLFAENYRARKIRKTIHADCAVDRWLTNARQHAPVQDAERQQQQQPSPTTVEGDKDEDVGGEGAKERMQRMLYAVMEQAKQRVEARHQATASALVPEKPRARTKQTSIGQFFQPMRV